MGKSKGNGKGMDMAEGNNGEIGNERVEGEIEKGRDTAEGNNGEMAKGGTWLREIMGR